MSEEDVLEKLNGLKNQLGRSAFKASGTRVYGAVKSVQGKWQANMFNKYPLAELEKVPKIPWSKVGTKEKVVVDQSLLKEGDTVNKSLKFRPISDGNFRSNKGIQA